MATDVNLQALSRNGVFVTPTWVQGDVTGMVLKAPSKNAILLVQARAGIAAPVTVDVQGVPAPVSQGGRDGTSQTVVPATAGEVRVAADLRPEHWKNAAVNGIDVSFSGGAATDVQFAWLAL